MNNRLSLVLNVVLLFAVAVLYYLHFNNNTHSIANKINGNDSTSAAKSIVIMPKEIKASKIVYINTDVLNEKYNYVKELSDVAKAKLQTLEAIYQKKGSEFQKKYATFQQKASQGLLSENEGAVAQKELGKDKAELEQMEAKQQILMEEMQKDNEKVLKTVLDYIKEYNKNSGYNFILAYSNSTMSPVMVANDSLDITNEIVEGLNAQYNAKKVK
ncbi:MAG: OmpH family outer membrane protein [Bacteroidia bacterium]